MTRKEEADRFGTPDDTGIFLWFTRKGIEADGWYDGQYGYVHGGALTWEKIDAIRIRLAAVMPRAAKKEKV